MLFEIKVYNQGEQIYLMTVDNADAAKNTADYFTVKYDEKADGITVTDNKGQVIQWLYFDVGEEDWVTASQDHLLELNLQPGAIPKPPKV